MIDRNIDTESLVAMLIHIKEENLDAVIKLSVIHNDAQFDAYFHIKTLEVNDLHLVISDGVFKKTIAWNNVHDAQIYTILSYSDE